MLGLFVRNWLEIPLIAAMILYGLIGGAIAGYLIGALVGGVFLVADKLRVMFENRAKAKASRATVKDVD
jgi:Flp pilus assembly pilin Flp